MKKYCLEKIFRTIKGNIKGYVGATLMASVIMMMFFASCQRRLIEDEEMTLAALIPVNIDWSESGINPTNGVHVVSIRFFPKDGVSPAFDCYLEGNPREGEILVPTGQYSVIVFNESLQDAAFWADKVVFTDVNSYSNFAANTIALTDAARLQQFPYYKPQPSEQFIDAPVRLMASWSLDNFEVTNNMILVTQGRRPASSLSVAESNMLNALKQITMRALTRSVTVTAQVENLISADSMYLAMQGLASKVIMATGVTTYNPSTHLFFLNGRQYSNGKDGTARSTFLCFGRTPAPESYYITADILLISKTLFEPTPPLLFNRTNEFIAGFTSNLLINLNIDFSLPLIEGGVAVDDWGDDEEHTVIEY